MATDCHTRPTKSTSAKYVQTWCGWCGEDLPDSRYKYCGLRCVQDALNDAKARHDNGAAGRLYSLRAYVRKHAGFPPLRPRKRRLIPRAPFGSGDAST